MNRIASRTMIAAIIAIICVTGIVLAQPLPMQGAEPEETKPTQPPTVKPTQFNGFLPAQPPDSSDAPAPPNQPIFGEPEQPQEPVEAPFAYEHNYTTELWNGQVEITDRLNDGFPAPMLPGDELYVSIVSPVPVNLYVTTFEGFEHYRWKERGMSDTMGTPEDFYFDQNLSREQTLNWNFTAYTTRTVFPYIVVDDIPNHMRNYDPYQHGFPELIIVRGSDYSDAEHDRANPHPY